MSEPRQKFVTRTIRLDTVERIRLARDLLINIPCDKEKPLEMVVREEVKGRKLDQQALMWACQLKDISAQAWHQGRQLSAEIWHEIYKRMYLPEGFDPELCKEGYEKWIYDRDNERILVGSTKQLTVKGFALYLQQIESDGAGMGVLFSTRENQSGRPF